jgi:hypothetical protein
MVTSRAFLWWGFLLVGCSGSTTAELAPGAYPGAGFVVHEWGTDTVVVGSDGSLQRGLHHEEEDLPGFVYDRLEGGVAPLSESVEVKMETPVTYFYSDVPREVGVSIRFPQGVFTQWYPAVARFHPKVAGPNAIAEQPTAADPVLDVDFPFQSETCAARYGSLKEGLIDWGTVQILPRDAHVDLPLAPLDEFTWSFAREVESNALRVSGVPGAVEPEAERFLFYRGLGNFGLPLVAKSAGAGVVHLENTYSEQVGSVFIVNVDAGRGAFVEHREGIAPYAQMHVSAPALEEDIDAFTEALGESVTAALDRTGLYHDEAVAMVNTWKRQWFRTPGLRLLYLVPQSWTEASIPLSLDVAPDELVRVMMIRVELITPELEALDQAALAKLSAIESAPEAHAYFSALGRFAEPRLRRAIAVAGSPPYADALLNELASADTNQRMGE